VVEPSSAVDDCCVVELMHTGASSIKEDIVGKRKEESLVECNLDGKCDVARSLAEKEVSSNTTCLER
jgi:hypothetical protein